MHFNNIIGKGIFFPLLGKTVKLLAIQRADVTSSEAIGTLAKVFSRSWIGPKVNDYHWAPKMISRAKLRLARK